MDIAMKSLTVAAWLLLLWVCHSPAKAQLVEVTPPTLNQTAILNQAASFARSCEVTGDTSTLVTLRWVQNGTNTIRTDDSSTSLSLVITTANFDMSGQYTCEAVFSDSSNPIKVEAGFLNVYDPSVISVPRKQFVQLNHDIGIQCTADIPDVTYTYFDPMGIELTSERIPNANFAHEGEYICRIQRISEHYIEEFPIAIYVVGFIQEPTDVNATVNSTIRWQCSAISRDIHDIYWKVNGTITTNISLWFTPSGEDIPSGITIVTLTVEQATVAYNNSRIQCVVVLNSDGEEITSRYAILTLQGALGAVGNLQARPSRNYIHLSWVAPFSLNITASGTNPYIWYSIEVIKRTQLHMLTTAIPCDLCSALSNTEYNFTESSEDIDPCSIYEFTVIAANVVGSGRTDRSSTILSSFLKEPDVAIRISSVISESIHCSLMITLVPKFPYCPGEVPETYRIFIQNTSNSTPSLVYESTQVLLVSQGIQGDTYASDVYITSTLLLIVHNQQLLYSGENYSLQIEARNAIGRRNITEWITINTPQLTDAEAYIDEGILCITCKFNPAPPTVIQNCTATFTSFNTSEVLRIAWGQHIHSSATECFDTVEPGVYTLRVFSEWDAQCSQSYPVISLQVEAPAPSLSNNIHCSTECVIGIAFGIITVLTVLFSSLLCITWRRRLVQATAAGLREPVDWRDPPTMQSIAYQEPKSVTVQQVPLKALEEPTYSVIGPLDL